MRIFINYVTDSEIYDMDQIKPVELSQINHSVDSIVVMNYPGSYTKIRKAIAVAKAISLCNEGAKLYGFSLFKYLNYHNSKNFFLEKYMYWKEASSGLFKELEGKDYISNIETNISRAIDCSSKKLISFINSQDLNLDELKQIYFDKFA